VASALALRGRAEAVRRVTRMMAKVLFILRSNFSIGYNRLFFFNTLFLILRRDKGFTVPYLVW
jgi:hypothetical protein